MSEFLILVLLPIILAVIVAASTRSPVLGFIFCILLSSIACYPVIGILSIGSLVEASVIMSIFKAAGIAGMVACLVQYRMDRLLRELQKKGNT